MNAKVNYLRLDEAESTNTWLAEHQRELPSLTVVTARSQTAGRGQRGNSWESEPGKNLTMSLLWRPNKFPARSQFAVSESVALAVADALHDYGITATVKWPNDIYVSDKKIAGILIEHAVGGRDIMYTIAGVGLNVNQAAFRSNAPNPVSMRQLLGRDTDIDDVLQTLESHLCKRLDDCYKADYLTQQHSEYMARMWRADGCYHTFSLPDGTYFKAMIGGVAPDGMLTLITEAGKILTFAFKEVAFVL